MQAFLELIAQKKLDIQSLITHRYALEQAGEAYALIEGQKKEPYLGIVLNYLERKGEASDQAKATTDSSVITLQPKPVDKNKPGLSFYGAGNYGNCVPVTNSEK